MASATKQALLAALSAAQGECISGQQLAQQLGVSRAAVHKAAAALAAQGYALEAAPRRGYRLAGGDPFCAEAVGEYDAPIYLYDKLESSNRTAKTLALEGTPHGTMVLTSQQTAGRGRLGRRFESPAGKGIYLSLVLRPGLPMTEAQAVTISAAVAVCRAVKRLCGLDLGIKWVNDLYYNGKKVCGILTEAGADIESGQPVYHKYLGKNDHGFDWIRASASMPLVSRIVEIEGRKLLDGGIADSIPVRYFRSIGYDRNVVVLTQPKDYQKGKNSAMPLIRMKYKRYPNLVAAMENRPAVYNETLAYIAQEEAAGRLLVLRPPEPLPVDRVEKDPEHLKAAYTIGRQTAKKRLPEIKAYLQG